MGCVASIRKVISCKVLVNGSFFHNSYVYLSGLTHYCNYRPPLTSLVCPSPPPCRVYTSSQALISFPLHYIELIDIIQGVPPPYLYFGCYGIIYYFFINIFADYLILF